MNPAVEAPIPPSLMAWLSGFLAEHTGLNFPPERWSDLLRGMAAAAREAGFADAESYIRWLSTVPPAQSVIEKLASHLAVGETYFFRDKPSMEAFEQGVLQELLHARRSRERHIRIWSAGCCTGEEPYSIAMLLDSLIPDPGAWNITLLATDINPVFLRKAAQGIYGEWSFRETPAWARERYFRKRRDGRFEISPRIRKMVSFSYLNLVDDVYPSLVNNTNAMDVIFCRNVLMYLTPECAKKVVGNFYNALVDGGWLFVGPVETSITQFSGFVPVEFPDAMPYRKPADGLSRQAPQELQFFTPARETGASPIFPVELPHAIAQEGAQTEFAEAAAARPQEAPRKTEKQQPPSTADPSAMARLYANQGRLDEAVAWCEKAIADDKLNPAHHYLIATIRQEEGRADEAARSLRHVLYLDPDFVLAHFALGNLGLSQGKEAEAERHFRNALALLQTRNRDEVVAGSDGLSAGRLIEIILAILSSQPQTSAAA